jgi:hypothetical protein
MILRATNRRCHRPLQVKMIDNKIIYYIILISIVTFCIYFGERDEKIASVTALFASVLTTITTLNDDWADIHLSLVIIDFFALSAFWYISLTTKNFWPYWITGWQIVVILGHIQRALFVDILPSSYSMLSRLMAYPMLALILYAALRRSRRDGLSTDQF